MLIDILLKRVIRVPVVFEPGQLVSTPIVTPLVGDILVLVAFAVVIAISYVTYSLIENPGRALGRRLVRKWQQPAVLPRITVP
jgi:peptidoglycan/LPS O-acetylase OafA/YrhL